MLFGIARYTGKTMIYKKTSNLNLLKAVSMIVAIVGATGSLYFMFEVGHSQKSVLFIALFTAWVLSPFIGLFLATKTSNHWMISAHKSLYWLMIILAIGS